MSQSLPELIGVAGSFASGKDTLARELVNNYGYMWVSTSDRVREIAMEKYGDIERPTLVKTAVELRQKKGAGALVEEALIKPRPLVVTGIRSLGEMKVLKRAGGVMVFVDAPVEIRYERMRLRSRDSETELTLEQFAKNEAREWASGKTDADFNLLKIKDISDIQLDNSGDLRDFISSALKSLRIKK